MARLTLYIDDGAASAAFVAQFEKLFARRVADVMDVVRLAPPPVDPAAEDPSAEARATAASRGVDTAALPAAWDGARVLTTVADAFRASDRATLAAAARPTPPPPAAKPALAAKAAKTARKVAPLVKALAALALVALAGCSRSCNSTVRPDGRAAVAALDAGTTAARPRRGAAIPEQYLQVARAAGLIDAQGNYVDPTAVVGRNGRRYDGAHYMRGRTPRGFTPASLQRPTGAARPSLGAQGGSLPGNTASLSSEYGVVLMYGDNYCSGSLIRAPQDAGNTNAGAWVVLTAAHCVTETDPCTGNQYNPAGLRVTGNRADGTVFDVGISTIVHNTNFETNGSCYADDVALLFLSERVSNPRYLRLPQASATGAGDGLVRGQPYTLTQVGYGNRYDGLQGTQSDLFGGPSSRAQTRRQIWWDRVSTYGCTAGGANDGNARQFQGAYWVLPSNAYGELPDVLDTPRDADSYQRMLVVTQGPGGVSGDGFGHSGFGDSGGVMLVGDMVVGIPTQILYGLFVTHNVFNLSFDPLRLLSDARGTAFCTSLACLGDVPNNAGAICGSTAPNDVFVAYGGQTLTAACGLRGLCPFQEITPTEWNPISCLGANQCTYSPRFEAGPRVSFYVNWINAQIALQTPPVS